MPTAHLRSLDVFRGLTVAAMVLVNSPGNDEVFAPLRHANWHGCTPADMIFPAFLVIMGVSAAYSDAARRERGVTASRAAGRALSRAFVLIGLGLLVNVFIYPGTEGVRYPGILQRIALCYLGVECFLLADRPAAEPAATAVMLLFYWFILTRVPVPGHGAGILTPDGNIAYWLDRRLFDGHLENDPWGDSEGLLATVPALATAMLGLIAGRRLHAQGAPAARRIGRWGLALAALGLLWGAGLPLNKHLWTSSFALYSGGSALAGLAALHFAVEARAAEWARPFETMGRHALALYLLAGFAYGVQESIRMPVAGAVEGNLKLWLTARLLQPWMTAAAASLAYAAIFAAAMAAAASLVAQRFDRRQQ